MDAAKLQELRDRYARGEKVTRLAKEVGLNWQFLWGLLKGSKPQPQPKSPRMTKQEREVRYYRDQRQRRMRQREHGGGSQGEGELTPRNPVTQDADGIFRITFDSVGDALRDAMSDYAQNEYNRKLLAERMREHLTGNDGWANYFTRDRLLDTIANPPKELTDAVEQMRQTLVDEVSPPVSSRRRVRRNQETGDELDPEQVLARSLTPWDRMTRETQPRRSVTIGVNLSVHAGRRAEHLLWRGAAAAALADILTQRGVNVEVVAFWSISDMSSKVGRVVSRYIVKRADMPMDVGAVSVALAEIAYARLVALYGLARHIPGRLHYGLGSCQSLPQQDREGIDYLAEQDITDRPAAEAWLHGCLSQQESGVLHV